MKKFITLVLSSVFAIPIALGNGETLTFREKAQGTARVDEEYLDGLEVRDTTLEKRSQIQKTRERMEENPRNPAMVDSFEEVSKEDKKEVKEKQEAQERRWR